MVGDLPNVALSIIQPWAWLIAEGHKDIENRRWSTRFRGPVLIHASRTQPDEDDVGALAGGLNPCDLAPMPDGFAWPPSAGCRMGGIVGVAEIIDCVRAHPSRWFAGPRGFVLANARPLPFRPCVGARGFFTPDYGKAYAQPLARRPPRDADLFR